MSEKEGSEIGFISLYLPPTASIDAVVTNLKNESSAADTKSKSLRDRNQAFKNLVQHLKQKKEIPENGLAVFAGAFGVDNQESNTFTVEELVPPEPIVNNLFEVDSHFHLEPLREMLRNPRVVALIVLDSKEATFGLLNGERLDLIDHITSGIPGKSGKGGQSQRRYERERDMELTTFFHRIAEHATKAFLTDNSVMAVLVGGPGPTKQDFLKGKYLHYELESILLNTVDTQSASKNGVKELVDKSSETVKNLCWPEEKMVMQRFLAELGKQDGLASYGLDFVLDALGKGEVEVALVTDSTNLVEVSVVCRRCGLTRTRIVDAKSRVQLVQELKSSVCEKCKADDYEVREKDIVDVLEDVASKTNAIVEVISSQSEEKAKLTALGGVAAILRYK